MSKKILITILIVLGLSGAFVVYRYYRNLAIVKSITTFQGCVDAGYQVKTSYPVTCTTSDNRTFSQDIGNELEYKDEILVQNPRPNQKISSPLTVHGQVSGRWLFEATFSGELYDAYDTSLGKVILQAEGDWMTIDFVPFSGVLEFAKPKTTTGTLKIINANPSGLPENEYILTIPVSFN